MTALPELLRLAMRHWTSGVSVVTSAFGEHAHGMTVSSFTSVSLEPPLVTVTLADDTRTHTLVSESGIFGITILSSGQRLVSDRFAGRLPPDENRFAGLDVFYLVSNAPLIAGGLAYLDCRVLFSHPLGSSTLFVGEVVAAQVEQGSPLVYHNRKYFRLIE